VRACNALLLVGAVVLALPPACIGQTDTTPALTDSTTRPVHSHVIDAARVTREGAVRDVNELLIDRVPGLLVVPGSGLTGTGSRIRMRGVQSLVDDRAPLVLVDGMRVDQAEDDFWASLSGPMSPGPLRLADLSVEDLASVEVITPAGAAMYGPEAADGVLLIRTTRTSQGPPRWRGYAAGGVRSEGASWPTNFGGVDIDSPDSLYRHGGCTLAAQAAGSCLQDFVQRFNPLVQRSPFRTALRRQYGLSVSGGSDRAEYRLAGDLSGSDGPFASGVASPDPNYYRAVNSRGRGTVRPWRSLEVSGSVAHISSDVRLPPDVLSNVVSGPADSTGFSWGPSFRNRNSQGVERTSGVLEARWTPWPWLALHGLAGWDAVGLQNSALSLYSRAAPRILGSSAEGHSDSRQRTLTLEGTVSSTLASRIRSTTTLGVQHLRDSLDQAWTLSTDTGSGFPVCRACVAERRVEWRHSLGYYAEEQLQFGRRVIVTGALRHDSFREFRKGMTHPSLGVSWVARDTDGAFLNVLALRAAYGSAGRGLPSSLPIVLVPVGTPVPRVDPEQTKSVELGADASLMGRRLSVELTYYDMRSDVLEPSYLSTPYGYSQTYSSGGVISNRGLEAVFVGRVLASPRIAWDVSLSLWGNRNRLLKFDSAQQCFGPVGEQCLRAGYPVGGYWTFPITYADTNGDGIIAGREVHRLLQSQWAGTPDPTQGAMLTSGWTFGNRLRLTATLDYRAGQTLFNADAWWRCALGTCRQANDPRTPLAQQAEALVAPGGPTPMFFEDADYLKLRELAVTLFAPPNVAAALRARTATITLAGRDLATWTGYSGVDPEAGSYGVGAPGRPRSIEDFATMPLPHSWTLRVDLVY
jgi:TonB-dependent starch-binding outer membrane protein SusC